MLDFQAEFGDLVIDGRAWEVYLNGELIDLTRTEFEILLFLASRPRRVVSDEELTRAVWGDGWFGDENNLAVHVSKLRRKLGESGLQPRFIRTIRGVGYRFDPGREAAASSPKLAPTYESLKALEGAVEVRTDAQLNVIATWPVGDRVLGFEPADLLGRYFPVIGDYPWSDHASALDGVQVLISSGVREWFSFHVVRRADGSLCQADFATRIEVDGRGQLQGLHFVLVERRWLSSDGGGGFADSRTSSRSGPSVRA